MGSSDDFCYKSDECGSVCRTFPDNFIRILYRNGDNTIYHQPPVLSALSQKLDTHFPFFHRFFIAYGITDEIFGVSVCREGKLSPFYSYGVIALAAPGWTLGTFLGIVSGNILPARVISALSVALYGMFIAVIIPPSRGNKILTGVVLISMMMSLIFTKAPILCRISSGFRIIILTLLIAGVAAYLFPIKEEEGTSYES